MTLSTAVVLSVPMSLIESPSTRIEQSGINSWLVPDQPTTTPPSMRVFIVPFLYRWRNALCFGTDYRCVVLFAVQRVPVNTVHVTPAMNRRFLNRSYGQGL